MSHTTTPRPPVGRRMTPIRRALLDIFAGTHTPLTSQELLEMLRQKNIHANKTTVYRQLDVLEQANMIQLVTLADRIQRYELVGESHHHHLVCLHCHKIEDVDFPTDLEQQEQLIAQTNNFKVSYHSLEFFGVCGKCQEGM